MPAFAERRGRYPLAILLVVTAVATRAALAPVWGRDLPFILLYPAVALASWYGGFGPGVLATALSAIAAWFFFVPKVGSFELVSSVDAFGLLIFLAVSTLISYLQSRCRNAELEASNLLKLATLRSERIEREQKLRLEVEAQAEADRKWAHAVMGSMGDALICTDVEGNITFLNRIAEEMTGWPLLEAKGQSIGGVFNIVSESTRLPAENPVRRVLQEGRIVGLANHTALIRRNGGEIPIDDSAAPIWSSDGKILGAVLVFRDIRDRKKVEDDLRLLAARLKRSNEDLSSFAHVISHDLQEPLRAISTLSELLRIEAGPRLDAEGLEHLDHIIGAAQRMVRMIRGLLEYSLVVHGADREPQRVPLTGVVMWAQRNLAERIEENGASIVQTDLPEVAGDYVRLVQVFQNLIGNALKYRSAAPPRILIDAEEESASTWRIKVADNGIGVPEDSRGEIFALFRRSAPEGTGWGIGLAVCKRIVESHGGRIWVEPGETGGSIFVLTLPK
jgi:PAS domain S-box-containing protein